MNYYHFKDECIIIKKDGTIFKYHNGYKRWLRLKTHISNGYIVASSGHKVHRLLAMAFIPNPDGLKEVDHIDRNRSNNDLSNLRWADDTIQANNRISSINSFAKYGVSTKNRSAYNKAHYDKNKEAYKRQHSSLVQRKKSEGLYQTTINGKRVWRKESERINSCKKDHSGMFRTTRIVNGKRVNVWVPLSEKKE